MLVPSQLQMKLVTRVDPQSDGGQWWQHSRDDSVGVGVVTNCRGRGFPQVEEWYADAIINQTFTSFKSLQDTAVAISPKEATEILHRYPFIAELDGITNPGEGHAVPRCMVNTGKPATHVGVLVQGWYRLRATSIFLGKEAVQRLRKERNPAFIVSALAAAALLRQKAEP